MKLTCYKLGSLAVEIEPGRPDRDWMDEYSKRGPYRCLPLVIANTSGWELLCPFSFTATWNGGPGVEDISIQHPFDVSPSRASKFVASHFARGVLTMMPGYLFRTEPGWDLWAGGPANHIKHGIQALTGVVETSWLPFPFTMNWRFTAPGTISFEKDEPFCMIMPVRHDDIDAVDPIVRSIKDDPELEAQGVAWRNSRKDFLDALQQREPGAL